MNRTQCPEPSLASKPPLPATKLLRRRYWGPGCRRAGGKESLLFTERLPGISVVKEGQVWEQIEEMRHDVLRTLLATGDINSVVNLRPRLKHHGMSGRRLGSLQKSERALGRGENLRPSRAQPERFYLDHLAAGLARFSTAWSSSVEAAVSR